MTVTLNNLRCNFYRFQTEFFTNIFFNERIVYGVGTDSTGHFTNGYVFLCMFQTFNISFNFSHPEAKFQTESSRFAMNTMGTTNHWRIFEFSGTATKYIAELMQIFQNDVASLFHHSTESRIFYVCRCKAEVNVFSFFANIFTDSGYERNNIMVCFFFNFMNSFYIKVRFFTDNLSRFFRNNAQFCLCFTS